MRLPQASDWLVYIGGAALILVLAFGRQEHANAPAPPPATQADQLPLAPSSPFSAKAIDVPNKRVTAAGTAFSVGDGGVWLTARHVLDGCRQPAIVVAGGQGVAAKMRAYQDDVAVLTTVGGSAALPLAVTPALRRGERVFLPGFPQGAPGEAASRLLGPQTMRKRGRDARPQSLLALAEVGRTDGLNGSLAGLSGAPVIDSAGEVVGVTLAEAPRRGRIYSSAPDAIRRALAAAGVKPPAPGAVSQPGEPMSVENYGRVADDLRRDLRVAQVVCLAA
jgi:serine protease Do